MDGIIYGTHVVVNPANGAYVDCVDLEMAKRAAQIFSRGYKEVPMYEGASEGNCTRWKKVGLYRNGRRIWATKSAAA